MVAGWRRQAAAVLSFSGGAPRTEYFLLLFPSTEFLLLYTLFPTVQRE
jgi:hypothetical protein